MQIMKRLIPAIKRHLPKDWKTAAKKSLAVLALALMILIVGKTVLSLLLAVGLVVIGSLSLLYRYIIPVSLGFELITFTSVLFSFAYSPIAGLIAAAIMVIVSSFLAQRICLVMLFKIISYSVMCLSAYMLLGMDIAAAGIILTVIYNVVSTAMIFLSGFSAGNSIISVPLNILLNIYLFTHVAPLVVGLL